MVKAVKQYHVFEDLDWTVSDSFSKCSCVRYCETIAYCIKDVWNFIEFTVGTIAACLPTLKPLFKDLLETARALTSGSRSRGTNYKVKGSKSSLGYSTPQDPWRSKEIALDSYTSTPTGSKAPYAVRITTRPKVSIDKEDWDENREDNDEGPLRPSPHHALGSNGGSNGTVRTQNNRQNISHV